MLCIILVLQETVGLICYVFGWNLPKRHKNTNNYINSDDYVKPNIHVRFVTKGVNPQQIIESCYDIQQSINDKSLKNRANWYVEVVSDNYIDLTDINKDINQIVVPVDYITPRNSLFKARALHYASVYVETAKDAWILHMDEESYFNTENGHKIVDHCDNEN